MQPFLAFRVMCQFTSITKQLIEHSTMVYTNVLIECEMETMELGES